ncbi:MAG: ABC transporter ATP-binding protein [Bacilli bacterium]|nr:ABC transporter ATP-binding protein [Bacilli bacterium]MBN2877379.1 ABC transporter ATP-binding protein [Bacilli bacterium]
MEVLENVSITINDLSKRYGSKRAIEHVNTRFESGKLNLIVGENGSGKSTLFKCIMGLVEYEGKIIKRRLRIGYAPEEYIMPMHLSVLDFLSSIGRIKGYPGADLSFQVRQYLEVFGLDGYEHALIRSLSHGMRQKVNLMQAFIFEPKILILDEPLASLDETIIPEIISLIQEKSKRNLVLISTHNPGKFKSRNKETYLFEDGCLNHE